VIFSCGNSQDFRDCGDWSTTTIISYHLPRSIPATYGVKLPTRFCRGADVIPVGLYGFNLLTSIFWDFQLEEMKVVSVSTAIQNGVTISIVFQE